MDSDRDTLQIISQIKKNLHVETKCITGTNGNGQKFSYWVAERYAWDLDPRSKTYNQKVCVERHEFPNKFTLEDWLLYGDLRNSLS